MPSYTICGFSIRGYSHYEEKWKPQKGELLECSISKSGSVMVMKEKGSECGSVQQDLQKVSKKFIRAGGTIKAKVKDETPVFGERGAEILCEYIWSGPPEEAKAARNVVVKLHEENRYKGFSFKRTKGTKDKKTKNLQKRGTDSNLPTDKSVAKKKQTASVAGPSHETQATDMAHGSGESMSSKKSSEQTGPSHETQVKVMENGSGENMSSTKASKQGKKTIKRCSDGGADGPEEKKPKTENVKSAKKKQVPKTENIKSVKNKQVPKTEKDPTTKHLSTTGNGLKKVKQNNEQKSQPKKKTLPQPCASGNQAGPSHETQATDMAHGSGENMSSKKSSEQGGPSHETQAKVMENGSGENIPGTKTKGKKTIKRCSDGGADGPEEKKPKTENVKSAKKKQVPKTEKDPTEKHLSKTGNGLKKVKQNTAEKNQPKRKTLQQPCGNQRPVQKDVNGKVDQRDKEGANLDSEHGKLEFNFVSESKQPSGSFSDTHGNVEPLLESDARSKISRSVCKIFYPTVKGNATATGFRVGSRYVMTARHVTKEFLEGLKHAGETYVIFNYKLDGIYKEEDKYFIKDVVYEAEETDIAVIELLDHAKGMPPHVEHFHSPIIGKPFHLIGHSQGKIMEANRVTKFIDLKDQNTKFVFDQLQNMSIKHTNGKGYVSSQHVSVYNPRRFLFQCKFTKGASGCPGIILVGEKIYVTTVLLHGYPDWYYDQEMEIYKSNWKEEHCIQQGVDPIAVYDMMRVTHPDLCQDIFGKKVNDQGTHIG